MRILFFTLIPIKNLNERGIYADMISEFNEQGDILDYYFPSKEKYFRVEKNITYNSIRTKENPQKQSNFIKKFFLYLEIEHNFSRLIQRSKKKYDLLIIVTPSIFQLKIINSFKKKNPKAKVLLLLKDIFPDNAIDLGILKNKFPISLLIKYFKSVERRLYKNVQLIGCMTPLNTLYIAKKHPNVKGKLFLSPNSIRPYKIPRIESKSSLGLPKDKTILIYTGNIGIPQAPEFIMEFIKRLPKDSFLVIIGNGSKFSFKKHPNLLIINNFLKQDQIDQYLINSDFGLIFLSDKFNLPNYPSKILSYINANLNIVVFSNLLNDLNPNISVPEYFSNIYSWNRSIMNSLNDFQNHIFCNKIKKNIVIPKSFLVSNQVSTIKKKVID